MSKPLLTRVSYLLLGSLHRWARRRRWRLQYARLERQMPWTIRNLRPRITPIKGGKIQYSTFEMVFDHYRVEFILLGAELDEIRILGASEKIGSRIDNAQKRLSSASNRGVAHQTLILNYGDLDDFLKDNHAELDEQYSRNKG